MAVFSTCFLPVRYSYLACWRPSRNMNQSLSLRKAHTCRSGESHVVRCLPSRVVVARIHCCDLTALVTSPHPIDEDGITSSATTHAAATVRVVEAARNQRRTVTRHRGAWLPGVKAVALSITRSLISNGDG